LQFALILAGVEPRVPYPTSFFEIGKIAEDTVNMEKKDSRPSDKWRSRWQSVLTLALGNAGAGTHGAIAE